VNAVIERPVTAIEPTEASSILAVIERAARSPDVDMDKMERLLNMHERIVERQAKAAYSAALSKMQPELPIIAERGGIKNKYGEVQSTYALWEDIVGVIMPILSRHGFALSFRTGNFEGGVSVTGVLSHELGHTEQTEIKLPIDGSGSKNAVQAVGSSTSYGKRYTSAALLNLRTGDPDDDGKACGAPLETRHDPRGESLTVDRAQVEHYVSRAQDIRDGDLDEHQVNAAIMALHDELYKDSDLYICVADELQARKIFTKGQWKAAIAEARKAK
jgi:hypothetical protein